MKVEFSLTVQSLSVSSVCHSEDWVVYNRINSSKYRLNVDLPCWPGFNFCGECDFYNLKPRFYG